ncbi:hypothetical protein B0H66DRAFT_232204 [Apodospora peruviana]|uniref:Uncharacterized protein n=1 Tax=Apodospora peruviana TaxID=516989 RepID=A0AAE0I506_9PEZI|nr:hypothetical protein B0H66DRAFT_232204 [Apodospora peruviana]
MSYPSHRGHWTPRSSSSAVLSGGDDDTNDHGEKDTASPRKTKKDIRHFAPEDKTKEAYPPVDRNTALANSVTAFFSRLRPSKRPERGFTTRTRRHASIWEEEEEHDGKVFTTRHSQGTTTTKRRLSTGGQSEIDDPDTIPASLWNTAISIPQRCHSINNKTTTKIPISTTRFARQNKTLLRVVSPGRERLPPDADADAGPRLDGAEICPPRKPVPTKAAAEPPQHIPARSTSSNRSSDQTTTREIFLAKQEARRQRRTLKDSGDFLGVTGVNPWTGEMDVITPTTSSGEEAVSPPNSYLTGLAQQARDARDAYEQAKNAVGSKDQDKMDKKERHREAIRLAQRRTVKWNRREGQGQWSSVAEPKLSPIQQSRKNSLTGTQSTDLTTIRRTLADSFLGMAAALPAVATTAISEAMQCRQDNETMTTETRIIQSQNQPQQPLEQHLWDIRDPPPSTGSSATSISSLSRAKTVRLLTPPRISSQGTSCSDATDSPPPPLGLMKKLGKVSYMSLRRPALSGCRTAPPACTLPRIPSGRILELDLEKLNPADRWASTLMQDLDGLERSIEANSQEMRAWAGSVRQDLGGLGKAVLQSAFIPTTTTTGSVPTRQHQHDGCEGEMDEMLDDALLTAALTWWPSPPSEEAMPSSSCLERLAFPPRMQRNVWRSPPDGRCLQTATATRSGREVEKPDEPTRPSPPDSDTTSAHQQTPTTRWSERRFQNVWSMSSNCLQKDMRKTMKTNDKDQPLGGSNILSPTSTSTCPPSPPSSNSKATVATTATTKRSSKSSQGAESELLPLLNQAIAQGAARQAFAQHVLLPQTTSLSSGTAAISDRRKDDDSRLGHGTKAGTGAAAHRQIDGAARAAAKTATEGKAGHHHGKPDLAGTLASRGLLTARRLGLLKEGGGVTSTQPAIDNTNDVGKAAQRGKDDEPPPPESPSPPLISDQTLMGRDEMVLVRLRLGAVWVRRLVCAYWRLVSPAFDAGSPLRKRFGEGRATGQDYGIGLMAVVFLVLAGSAGVWAIRTVVGMVRLVSAVVKGVKVLAGF